MRLAVVLGAPLVACGDDAATTPDARIDGMLAPVDAAADATVDGASPSGCDYTEMSDATNASTGEATGLTFGDPLVLCGHIDHGHFAQNTVDVDTFQLTVAAEADVLVDLTGAGAETLGGVVASLRDNTGAVVSFGRFEGTRATFAAHVVAGNYTLAVDITNATDPSAAIAYELAVRPDAPLIRCPVLTGTSGRTSTSSSIGSRRILRSSSGAPSTPMPMAARTRCAPASTFTGRCRTTRSTTGARGRPTHRCSTSVVITIRPISRSMRKDSVMRASATSRRP